MNLTLHIKKKNHLFFFQIHNFLFSKKCIAIPSNINIFKASYPDPFSK